MQNLDCVVWPPFNIVASTPLVVDANAIVPSYLTLASNARYIKAFPVPPGTSTKNNPDLFEFTLSRKVLKAFLFI